MNFPEISMVAAVLEPTRGRFDARVAELSAWREKADGGVTAPKSPALPAKMVEPVPRIEPEATIEDRLSRAREELSARLGAEIRPERRALLSRGDLAKIVEAAVQAYFVRHAIDGDPLSR